MEINRGDTFEVTLPSHVKIKADTGGLTEDSVLLCEQIRVIDKKRVIRKIGNLDNSSINKVNNALKIILGLSV